VSKTLQNEGLKTTHLVSIGGWNAPHPNTTLTGGEWWSVFKEWNRDVMSRPFAAQYNFSGFDGIDWDLEGNNDVDSQWNVFSQECLDLMGSMSSSAHDDGYIVTLVPPESYMDVTTSKYDRSLLHSYPEPWHPEFKYHGHNVYAYLLGKYTVKIFDLVDIQLYETFSHATYYINQVGVNASDYLVQWIQNVTNGWMVEFENDRNSGLKNQVISIPYDKLIVGFSFGDNGNGKTVFIDPIDVKSAFTSLRSSLKQQPRGVMYWNAHLDQQHIYNGTYNERFNLAKAFNRFLHTR
jgi:hypothetical protein